MTPLDEIVEPICKQCGADLTERCISYLNGEGPLCTACASLVNEENLRAEGFSFLEDDESVMWLLNVGQEELSVSFSFRSKTLEIEGMVIRRGTVTIGDVRLLLKALGRKA